MYYSGAHDAPLGSTWFTIVEHMMYYSRAWCIIADHMLHHSGAHDTIVELMRSTLCIVVDLGALHNKLFPPSFHFPPLSPLPSFVSVPPLFSFIFLPLFPLPSPPSSSPSFSTHSVSLTHKQWTADSVNDMYADAVLAVILQIESNPRELESTFNIQMWL